ncbi:MAG: adenylyltransferase/cytidyltransferase family protein [Spirochaeta sp.]|jgi:HTH-type transcriptional repressor of NAD biosynthesis genes|nr:adenylyltransferase/cytidyltransferase family protein [Spirochaeta sp.]
MNGVIIGRFMPPHNGHLYLIDFARNIVDTLYILVCTLSHEPIPGQLRFDWVRELAPMCKTIHITEEIPEARRGAAGATAIWANTVRTAVPEPISHVFASEEYGWDLAAELDARFVPVDPSRNNIPVSATAVRQDPYGTWQYIPPAVRPFFVKHIAVVGNPALTEELAGELETVVVHSYRDFWRRMWSARHGEETDATLPQDLITRGVRATATALSRQANRVLLYDIAEPRDLSGIETIDAVVVAADERDACAALVPERPILDTARISATDIRALLHPLTS